MASLFLFSGCGKTPAVKMENEILIDVNNTSVIKDAYPDFTVSGITISKRETDTKNKIDVVFVDLTLENAEETVAGKLPLKLEYKLYDNGWILDSCDYASKIESSDKPYGTFQAKKDPQISDSDINNQLVILYNGDISKLSVYENDVDLAKNADTISVTAVWTDKDSSNKIDVTLYYTLDNYSGKWLVNNSTMNSSQELWNNNLQEGLIGTWQRKAGNTKDQKIIFYSDGSCLVDDENGHWKIIDQQLKITGGWAGGEFFDHEYIIGTASLSQNVLTISNANVDGNVQKNPLVFVKQA